MTGYRLSNGHCICDSLNFILLRRMIRGIARLPVSLCLTHRFCTPVKLRHAVFLPLAGFAGTRVVPATSGSFLHHRSVYKCIRSRATTYVNKISNGTKLFSATRRITGICRVLLGNNRFGNGHFLDRTAYHLFAARGSTVDHHNLKFSGPSMSVIGHDPYTPSTPRTMCKRAKFANAYT